VITTTSTPDQDLDRASLMPGRIKRTLAALFPHDPEGSHARSRGVLLLVIISAAVTAATAWRLLGDMNRGLDLSDEGTYLAHAQPASRTVGMASFYGRYTSVLFSIVGQDVARFRAVGFILLALAGVACGVGLTGMVVTAYQGRAGRLPFVIAGIAGVNGALLYYYPRLLTPSYNWMVAAAVMWAIGWIGLWWTGVVLEKRLLTIIAATQVATGAFFGFMAKFVAGPVLAVVLLLVAVALAWRERRLRLLLWDRFALPAGATMVAWGLFHFVFRSSPSESLAIIRQARDWYTLVDPVNYTVGGALGVMWDLVINAPARAADLTHAVSFLPLLAPLVSASPVHRRRVPLYAVAIGGTLVSLSFRGNWSGGSSAFMQLGEISLSILVTLFFVAVSELVVLGIARVRGPRSADDTEVVRIEIPLIVFATIAGGLAIPFGSYNGPLLNLSFSLGLILIVTTVLLLVAENRGWFLAAAFGLVVAIGTPLILLDSRLAPYRQRPTAEQTVAVQVGVPPSDLLVDVETATYLTVMQDLASGSGFVAGTPLLDFTHFTTGAVWALGGRTPDTVFLGIGDLAESPEWIRRGVERLDPDVFATAWLLTGSFPNSPDPGTLSIIGRDFPADYVNVGEALWWHTGEMHTLWRPIP
jgi:hypothetical protein